MNYFRVDGAIIAGLQALPIRVECAQSRRLPYLQILGASAAAAAEARERVIAALSSCRFRIPARRITVRIEPAMHGLPFEHLDLAVAVAILGASGAFPAAAAEGLLFCGKLGLDGALRPLGCRSAVRRLLGGSSFDSAVLPWEGSEILGEAALRRGGGFTRLQGVLEALREGRGGGRASTDPELFPPAPSRAWDRIQGQEAAKRMLEVAAAGAHHVLLTGGSGAQPELLAHALSALLPPLGLTEAEEVAAIYSLAGWSSAPSRPFVAFTGTAALPPLLPTRALGGLEEVLLAHRGVLFIDRACERRVFPALLEPMRAGSFLASIGGRRSEIPAEPLVVAHSAYCACGGRGDPLTACACRPTEARRFRERSLRLLQYPFDLSLPLEAEAADGAAGPELGARLERVRLARARMWSRQGRWNGRLEGAEAFELLPWKRQAESLWRALAGRAPGRCHRFASLARVALTICDLRGGQAVEERDLLEARHYFAEAFSAPSGRKGASPSVPAVNSIAIP